MKFVLVLYFVMCVIAQNSGSLFKKMGITTKAPVYSEGESSLFYSSASLDGDYKCEIVGDVEDCTCLPGYLGAPPNCAPPPLSCTEDTPCGPHAFCAGIEGNRTCSCQHGFVGLWPNCTPPPLSCTEDTPCGPHALCAGIEGNRTCSCQQGFVGLPPNCTTPAVMTSGFHEVHNNETTGQRDKNEK